MFKKTARLFFLICGIIFSAGQLHAQDKRAQLPDFLTRTHFDLNIGYINYPFSQSQLEPGFRAGSIHIPHAGVSLAVLCHRFGKNISGQLIYMRPVNWVQYKNVNRDNSFHSVFLNILGLTAKSNLRVKKKLSVYGEAGPALFTRLATFKDDSILLKGTTYLTLLGGAGLEYSLNTKWKARAGLLWSPANDKAKQPHTLFISGGITYTMHPLPEEIVQRNLKGGFIFPVNLIQVGYTSNAGGYGVNRFFAEGAVPVFWSGIVRISRGITIQYQRNIFHGRKTFSVDWGSSLSSWTSKKNNEHFITWSVFPVFRFTLLHFKPADFYFNYSAAGPTYLSKVIIDDKNTGKHFTFQDFMGIGIFAGKKRNINAEIKIQHYSNGNIFMANPGLQIPLTLSAGYTF
ncbi:MAG: acyloxyacyl hydrolase [Chitinophagaceae bacterium]